MRIQRTSQLTTASVIGLSALSIACAFVARHLRAQQEQAYERRRLMSGYINQLPIGSDRLTTAVPKRNEQALAASEGLSV